MQECHVAIIGGGIGGLAAALSLQHEGLRASVFERAPELREVGAGLVLTGSSLLGLDHLGIGDAVRAVAGSLGSAWVAPNTMIETISSVSAPRATRRTMKRASPFQFDI